LEINPITVTQFAGVHNLDFLSWVLITDIGLVLEKPGVITHLSIQLGDGEKKIYYNESLQDSNTPSIKFGAGTIEGRLVLCAQNPMRLEIRYLLIFLFLFTCTFSLLSLTC
jgi:hypothetical protein